MSKHVPEVYRAAERLNEEIAYTVRAGYRVNVDLDALYTTGDGVDVVNVRVEVLRPIPPDEVPIAIKEPA